MKETNEFWVFLGNAVDATVFAFDDGVFKPGEDLLKYFTTITSAPSGLQGLGKLIPEAAGMSNEAKANLNEDFYQLLGHLDDLDADDVAGIQNGVVSVMRLAGRAREKGRADGYIQGRADLIADLRGGRITVDALLAEE